MEGPQKKTSANPVLPTIWKMYYRCGNTYNAQSSLAFGVAYRAAVSKDCLGDPLDAVILSEMIAF